MRELMRARDEMKEVIADIHCAMPNLRGVSSEIGLNKAIAIIDAIIAERDALSLRDAGYSE